MESHSAPVKSGEWVEVPRRIFLIKSTTKTHSSPPVDASRFIWRAEILIVNDKLQAIAMPILKSYQRQPVPSSKRKHLWNCRRISDEIHCEDRNVKFLIIFFYLPFFTFYLVVGLCIAVGIGMAVTIGALGEVETFLFMVFFLGVVRSAVGVKQ